VESTIQQDNILLVWDRMGDYHRARWRALQAKNNSSVYAADLFASDDLYKWESTEISDFFACLSINNKTGAVNSSSFTRFSNFRRILKDNNISTVFIPGYQHLIYLLFILFARSKGCRVVMFAESWYRSNRLIEYVKSLFLRLFVDHFFVSGDLAKFHFINNLNIPSTKITTGYSVVDNEHFANHSSEDNQNLPILLCVARYAPEKNIKLLINAFIQSSLYGNWELVLLGDGPEREHLEQLISPHSSIFLTGWKHYNELPEWYAKASCFILPSLFEPWGLAVNEAMAAGLPIILSDECGCIPDLLSENNGWSFSATNEEQCIEKLNDLYNTTPVRLIEMGQSSRNLVSAYSVTTWAETCLRYIIQN